MSLTIKAFLLNKWGGDPLEIRRFTVDQDVTTSFTYLVQKIAQVFPSLRADDITVAWMGERTRSSPSCAHDGDEDQSSGQVQIV